MTTMSEEGLELFGRIVSQNVDDLAAVNAHLYAMQEREAKKFAKAYLDFYEAIERIPDTIRSVHLNQLLDRGYVTADAAYRLLEEHPS